MKLERGFPGVPGSLILKQSPETDSMMRTSLIQRCVTLVPGANLSSIDRLGRDIRS